MDIVKIAERVESKEDFIDFLEVLIADFLNNNEKWENSELGRYLEAMEHFLKSSNDMSINKIDFTPSWALFAKIMIAASVYE